MEDLLGRAAVLGKQGRDLLLKEALASILLDDAKGEAEPSVGWLDVRANCAQCVPERAGRQIKNLQSTLHVSCGVAGKGSVALAACVSAC